MRKILAMVLLLMVAVRVSAAPAAFDHQHQAFTSILKSAVKMKGPMSQVDYKALKANPKALESYLESLSQVNKPTYDGWTKAQKMTFLINAYNGFTLKLVVDHYPVPSIKKIGGMFSSPWKMKFFKLLGEEFSLDRIEHQILRKEFKDARVHFAVNCASIGCPRLRDEAYSADKLDSQLNDQAQAFLRDSSRNAVHAQSKTLELSKIFDWFKEDFSPSVAEFVSRYMTDDRSLQTVIKTYKVKFLDYDWGLNEVKP